MMRAVRLIAILAGMVGALQLLPARAQDESDVVVRLSQLEAQMRQMSGKIEELQFQNQQLRDQLRRFQEDTDFRLQDSGKAAGSATTAPHPPVPRENAPPRQIVIAPPSAPQSPPSAPASPAQRSATRGDVFNPEADPGAPGAPRQLGSPESAAPPPVRRSTVPGAIMGEPDGVAGDPATPLDIAGIGNPPGGPQAQPRQPETSIAATGTDSARADFDNAYTYIQQHQFEQAEMGFRSFLQSHPRSKLAPDATYWLGESYLQRARYREAAEQFLKITTSYGGSPKGPDSMLKLGVSLRGLGANDQACATFAEVGRKYPSARPALLADVHREQQRAKCPS
ncbi:MAG: tol-pal system protein YbgF [Hyphomicrobiales bacterium]|nr:tol-pal system protein YbgF [Hyphomicrobiales bacterium]